METEEHRLPYEISLAASTSLARSASGITGLT